MTWVRIYFAISALGLTAVPAGLWVWLGPGPAIVAGGVLAFAFGGLAFLASAATLAKEPKREDVERAEAANEAMAELRKSGEAFDSEAIQRYVRRVAEQRGAIRRSRKGGADPRVTRRPKG